MNYAALRFASYHYVHFMNFVWASYRRYSRDRRSRKYLMPKFPWERRQVLAEGRAHVGMRSGHHEAYMISLMFANLPYGYIVFYGAPIKASWAHNLLTRRTRKAGSQGTRERGGEPYACIRKADPIFWIALFLKKATLSYDIKLL